LSRKSNGESNLTVVAYLSMKWGWVVCLFNYYPGRQTEIETVNKE